MTKSHPWISGILSSALVGVLVASVMSFLDWRLNPSGIFHGDHGTSWGVVWETWVSWFIPVAVWFGVVALPAFLWRARRPSGAGPDGR